MQNIFANFLNLLIVSGSTVLLFTTVCNLFTSLNFLKKVDLKLTFIKLHFVISFVLFDKFLQLYFRVF